MELHDALAQIAEIRQQVARTEVFRGYRSLPVAVTAGIAFVGAACQATWLPEPARTPLAYVAYWVAAAGVCLAATGGSVLVRYWRSSSVARSLTWLAVEQLLPCLAAGGLLTLVLVRWAADSLWLLPGLWAVIFSQGVFASARLLPRPVFWVGQYYLIAGLLVIVLAQREWTFTPWAMAIPFGGGQALAAVVLYWTLERNHEAR